MCPTNFDNLDLVVVPMISLNPKKAKKKMKKAALAEDSTCVDARLPVDKFDVDSFEVVPPLSLNSKKVAAKKLKPAPDAVRPMVEKKLASPTPQADSTSPFMLEGLKKSWYDISMDDDDDFLGAVSKY